MIISALKNSLFCVIKVPVLHGKRGCVKIDTSSFLCTKLRLSQARALLFPKVFVPLGIKKISL